MIHLTQPILAILVILTLSYNAVGQKFRYGLNLGYDQIQYSFPVERDRYHTSSIEPFDAIRFGASAQYPVTSSFFVGTGLQYLSVSGKNDGGHIQGRFVNPNGDGRLTFDVDNVFLIFPVDFRLLFAKGMIRPAASGGLHFFKALKQNIVIQIEPDDPDPSEELVRTEINDKTTSSYFGARLGAGIVMSPFEKHEFELMLHRDFYKSRYTGGDPMMGIHEKHEITFNIWELGVAWALR